MAGVLDYLAPGLQTASTLLSAGGQLSRGNAAALVGQRRKTLADFEAAQLETEATQSEAVGQRNAADVARQVAIVNSSALARAAASGAGASDPTVTHVLAQTASEGAYRQALALYEGEAQARLDKMRAQATRFQGGTDLIDAQTAQRASRYGAASTLLSGGAKVANLYDKYWSGPSPSGGASGDAGSSVLDAGSDVLSDFA
jgi:hypothetical protein